MPYAEIGHHRMIAAFCHLPRAIIAILRVAALWCDHLRSTPRAHFSVADWFNYMMQRKVFVCVIHNSYVLEELNVLSWSALAITTLMTTIDYRVRPIGIHDGDRQMTLETIAVTLTTTILMLLVLMWVGVVGVDQRHGLDHFHKLMNSRGGAWRMSFSIELRGGGRRYDERSRMEWSVQTFTNTIIWW